MKRPKLTGLGASGRSPAPVDHRCACGCGQWASFGFPGGLWFTGDCIPPALARGWRRPTPEPLPDEAGASAPRDAATDQFGRSSG